MGRSSSAHSSKTIPYEYSTAKYTRDVLRSRRAHARYFDVTSFNSSQSYFGAIVTNLVSDCLNRQQLKIGKTLNMRDVIFRRAEPIMMLLFWKGGPFVSCTKSWIISEPCLNIEVEF